MKFTVPQLGILAVSAVCAMCATPVAPEQTQQQTSTAGAAGTRADAVAGKSYELDVDGSKQWVDTNIDLRAGEKIHIAGTGKITYPSADTSKPAQSFDPDGL